MYFNNVVHKVLITTIFLKEMVLTLVSKWDAILILPFNSIRNDLLLNLLLNSKAGFLNVGNGKLICKRMFILETHKLRKKVNKNSHRIIVIFVVLLLIEPDRTILSSRYFYLLELLLGISYSFFNCYSIL